MTPRMSEAVTIGQVLDDALAAYEELAELAESVEEEWTYVTDVTAAWRDRLEVVVAERGGDSSQGAGAGGRRAGHR